MPGSGEDDISQLIRRDLINLVKKQTNVSYMKSKTIVDVVLSEMAIRIPSISYTIVGIRRQRKISLPSGDLSEDAIALRQRFDALSTSIDVAEQGISILDEDEFLVKGCLDDLLDILINADPDTCRSVVQEDGYTPVHTLVLYYQKEARNQLRLLMLEIFGALCGLDAKVVTELKNSMLPAELARDMKSTSATSQRFMYSCQVLTMLFSMGEPLPIGHYEHLNEDFLRFLFSLIENQPVDDVADEVRDRIIPVILAFNLHLQVPANSPVMNVLAKQPTVNKLFEELMLLINREVDPVRVLPHDPRPPNSLTKFLSDMYSRQDTARLFHTNDEKLLMDILLRLIQDCTPDDRVRTEYLTVFRLMLKNSTYQDHRHRQKDFQEVLMSICLEDDSSEDATKTRLIVKQIWKEFPKLFFA